MRAAVLRPRLALGTFASSLALLAANDWLLKGHGVLPSGVTGKLSDFAGLIVAPVCLVSLLAIRRRSAQLCCIAVITVVFALTKLSPACAELLETTLAWLGLSWRVWPDRSDLLALAVLPISWFCCRALLGGSSTRGPATRIARWLAIPACAACLASGEGPDSFYARAYLYNATRAPALIEVSNSWLSCDAFGAFDHPFLELNDFTSLGAFEVPAGAVLPLEPGSLGDGSGGRFGDHCVCPALRISSAGRTIQVQLQDLPRVDLPQKPSRSELKKARRQVVVLRDEPEPFEIGSALGRFDLALPDASTSQVSCGPAPPALDASFPPGNIVRSGSDSGLILAGQQIVAITAVAGNCFALELTAASSASLPTGSDLDADAGSDADAGASPSPEPFNDPVSRRSNPLMQVCAPLELFPFQVGDRVQLEWTEHNTQAPTLENLELSNQTTHFRLTRGRYEHSSDAPAWQDFAASLPAVRCGPLRDADGSLFEPVDVAFDGQALVPGQAVSIPGTSLQIYLGRAQRRLASACGTDGTWMEMAATWTD
jgi:hypothetical protein